MVKKIIVFGGLFLALGVQARVMMLPEPPNLERFKSKTTLQVEGITTPKVVLFETNAYLGNFVAIQDKDNKNFVPHKISHTSEKSITPPSSFSASATIEGSLRNLSDQNKRTTLTFDPLNIEHTLSFKNTSQQKLKGLKIDLPADTMSPKKMTIEVKFQANENWKPIIRNQSYRNYITFPEITPSEVRIKFLAPNLLRISEIEVIRNQKNQPKTQIAFFASEGQTFFLWSEPDFGQKQISVSPTMSHSIRTDKKTPRFSINSTELNPVYNPDFDQDGINDVIDLCPQTHDSKNQDIDNNQRGDVCEDPDQDGYVSNIDNCPFVHNRSQADQDVDGLGDACDNSEDRYTEQGSYWIKISFGLMIFALFFLIIRSALRKEDESK